MKGVIITNDIWNNKENDDSKRNNFADHLNFCVALDQDFCAAFKSCLNIFLLAVLLSNSDVLLHAESPKKQTVIFNMLVLRKNHFNYK